MDHDLPSFMERFGSLLDEAKGFGVTGAVVLATNDPLNDEGEFACRYNGGVLSAVGMGRYLQTFAEREFSEGA